MTRAARGTIAIPEATHELPVNTNDELDARLARLQGISANWAKTSIRARTAILDAVISDTLAVAERWVATAVHHKGIPKGSALVGEEWQSGPGLTIRHARLLRDSLKAIDTVGHPDYPGPVTTRPDGITTVGVFPTDQWDKLMFLGYRCEVWMQEGVTADNLHDHMAVAYKPGADTSGTVTVVLGAGNIASIPPMDSLSKLFIENSVVMLKMNPVNEYLGPILSEALRALIAPGYLEIVYGGADVGEYLVRHPEVDRIHITGSDKAHDAIVFGPGEEGRSRKEANTPILDKAITSELGNVTPVIVVPGPWSESDLRFQGENLATGLVHNGGFNCIATRVIVTHREWDQRPGLLGEIRNALGAIPNRKPYYPGAVERWRRFVDEHDDAERYGPEGEDRVPWTFIPHLDAGDADEICFTTESFAGVFGETPISATDVVSYLAQAVEFCNEKLWGTLGATIMVHPASLKDPAIAAAVDKAIADLRYGSVSINVWVAVAYAAVTTTWGAYPGHEPTDIQSGRGVVHNAYMFDRALKSVNWGPFKPYPKPPWFATHRKADKALEALTRFEATRSPLEFARIMAAAARA